MSKEQGLQSILVRSFSSSQTLNCGTHAGSVYEGEHVVQAFICSADELAFSVFKVDLASRRAVAAHLVLDATNGGAIEFACNSAIVIGLELGNRKEGDTTSALRSTWQASKHARKACKARRPRARLPKAASAH